MVKRIKMNVMIDPSVTELGEVVVVSKRGFPCENVPHSMR